MRGGERNYVYGLSIGKTVRSIHPKGVKCLGEVPVVKDAKEQGGMAYAILPESPFVDFFPKDSLLVVRAAALQLEASISSTESREQTGAADRKKDNADLRKRIEAVLAYARNFPKGTKHSEMAERIIKQHKNPDYSKSALRQILSGRYDPMRCQLPTNLPRKINRLVRS